MQSEEIRMSKWGGGAGGLKSKGEVDFGEGNKTSREGVGGLKGELNGGRVKTSTERGWGIKG